MAKGDEQRLLREIRTGQREACAELVRTHYPAIYSFLFHLARDAAQAEDLTQETFAAVWQKLDSFEGRSSFTTWLHRIAYGKFIDARRASKRRAALMAQGRGMRPQPGPLELAAAGDEAQRLHQALARLEEPDRAMLVLHYLQGLSYREMSQVVAEPVGTVKWRTNQALARLRTLLIIEMSHEQSQATL